MYEISTFEIEFALLLSSRVKTRVKLCAVLRLTNIPKKRQCNVFTDAELYVKQQN